MNRVWLACALSALAFGGSEKKPPSTERAALCTDNTDGKLDSSGRCRCECNNGPEGGGGCAFFTLKSHLHGADDWCPKDLVNR